jgi:hypothetical protein
MFCPTPKPIDPSNHLFTCTRMRPRITAILVPTVWIGSNSEQCPACFRRAATLKSQFGLAAIKNPSRLTPICRPDSCVLVSSLRLLQTTPRSIGISERTLRSAPGRASQGSQSSAHRSCRLTAAPARIPAAMPAQNQRSARPFGQRQIARRVASIAPAERWLPRLRIVGWTPSVHGGARDLQPGASRWLWYG